MNKIISLTEAAISRVQKLLEQKKSSNIFRIAVDDGSCSGKEYVVEIIPEAKIHDKPVKIKDGLVVYVDEDSINLLQGSVLDCEDKGLGMWQWVFRNPNAKNTCGCGESFSVGEKKKE